MITLNNIIAFIQKAMDENFEIRVNSSYITIYNNIEDCKNYFEISFSDEEEKTILYVDCFFNENGYKIELKENKDILEWKLFIETVKNYYYKCIENKFNNFFKEDANKPADIYDLDDEEDK